LESKEPDFLLDVWSFDSNGNKLHPYKGKRGEKKGLYSVNLTNDTNNFVGYTEDQLVDAIVNGKFKQRGTIRMLPLDYKPSAERNAFCPQFYKGKHVKDFGRDI
jgi:hypothetical protein